MLCVSYVARMIKIAKPSTTAILPHDSVTEIGAHPSNVLMLDISDVTKANIQNIHSKGQIAVCTFSAGTVTQRDDDMYECRHRVSPSSLMHVARTGKSYCVTRP
jgi:hypothetical protein